MGNRNLFKKLYLALIFESLVVGLVLLFSQHDPANAWLLGISKTRLLLSAGVLISTGIFVILAVGLAQEKPWEKHIRTFVSQSIQGKNGYRLVMAGLAVMLFASYYLFFLSGQIGDNLVRVRLERLRPLIVWMGLLAGQSMWMLPLLRYGSDRKPTGRLNGLLKIWIWAFIFLGGLAAIAAATRIGLDRDKVGWDNPGTPLLFVQLVLVVAAAGTIKQLLVWGAQKFKGRWEWVNANVLIAVVIWLSALAVWLPVPIEQTYFSPHPRPPNHEFYPYSDAGLHDIASQNLILGEGYAPLAEKPLYSLFLAVTHLLFGQDYQVVVNVQTILLAFFPVVIYLLASRMHNRTAGAIAAGMIILREWNTIALSPQIRVSHSKLLMTDLPAAFLISIFVAVLFKWLSKPGERPYGALAAGGSLGLVLLIRSQAIIFLPVVLLGMLLMFWKRWKALVIQGAVFTLMVLVVIAPWMLRNYQRTGIFGYSQPNQALYIAKQYSLTPEEADPGFPEDTTIEEYTSLGFAKMIDFTRSYPGVVAQFIASHFMRNEISTLLIFPMSISDVAVDNAEPRFFDVDPFVWGDCCSLRAAIERYPFWGEWTGDLTLENTLLALVNLGVISLGVGAAWRRWHVLGVIPLALHFAYSFSVAIARVSGWRLILPADWIAIVYYCLGLAVLMVWATEFFSGGRLKSFETEESEGAELPLMGGRMWFSRKTAAWLVLFAALGAIVPLAESLFPARYEPIDNVDQVLAMDEFSELISLYPGLDTFLETEGAVAAVGRALYPRYYRQGQFEPGGKWPGNVEFPSSRLAFYLAGPTYSQVVLPLGATPDHFPNATDAAVLGCLGDGHIQAFAVVVHDANGSYVYFDESQEELTCTPESN